MTFLVSVIIPCRNGEAWLGAAIESCLAQTWKDIEIIVVDDASTDASLPVARRYASPTVAVIAATRRGASAARNEGLARTRGDFIQFLDADDVLAPRKLSVQMERLAAYPGAAVASGAWARFRNEPREATFSPEPVWRDFAPDEFLVASWQGGGMMPNFAWLTPRATIAKAGPWNERLGVNDDGEFFTRILLASSRVLFCGDAAGYYRTAAGSTLSGRRDRAALASAFEAIELSCGHLLAHGGAAAASKACATLYQRFAFDAYPDAPDLVAAAERKVEAYGGSDLAPVGGRMFRMLSRSLGWKFAKRCRLAWHAARGASAGPARRARPAE